MSSSIANTAIMKYIRIVKLSSLENICSWKYNLNSYVFKRFPRFLLYWMSSETSIDDLVKMNKIIVTCPKLCSYKEMINVSYLLLSKANLIHIFWFNHCRMNDMKSCSLKTVHQGLWFLYDKFRTCILFFQEDMNHYCLIRFKFNSSHPEHSAWTSWK